MAGVTDDDLDAALAGLVPPAGLRRATGADLDALYALHCAHDREYVGRERQNRDDLLTDITRPGTAHWLRDAADGTADIWLGGGSLSHLEHNFAFVMLLPGTVDDGTGRDLVRFAAAAAARLDPSKDVHLGVGTKEADLSRWVTEVGGTEARRFGRMELTLDPAGEHAAAPQPPGGVTVRNAADADADWHVLYDVVEYAFRDHYGHREQSFDDFLADVRADIRDFSLVWVAEVDGRPAAALLGDERPAEGYIGTLGTLREFRGRGLARLLLRTAFAEFARRGHGLAVLHVDLSNPTGAVHVYETAGMHLADYEIDYAMPTPR